MSLLTNLNVGGVYMARNTGLEPVQQDFGPVSYHLDKLRKV